MRIFFRVVLVPLLLLILGFSPFVNPSSAAAADTGDILVADPGSGAIRRYSATGVELSPFAEGLSSPSWITADQFGNIYVSEHDGSRISKFSATGARLLTFTTLTSTTPYKPGGIRVSADGTIYVADYFGGKVDRYSADGTPLGQFVATALTPTDFIAFDGRGNLYVTGTDFVIDVVRRFSPTGDAFDFVSDFAGAAGIAFDADGNLYVSSSINNTVEKFSPSGTDLGPFASTALSASLMGMAFDASRTLYVANSGEGLNILRSSTTGVDLVVFASAGLVTPRDLVIMPQVVNPPPGVPIIKEECKTDGWQSFDFKTQGDCIQYINTGK